METKVMVVPEVLNDNNYTDWSVRIRTYLMAQDLWKIVAPATDDDEPPKQKDEAWNTKNFMALHVIQNGCGPKAFRMIRYENSAKGAWRRLADEFRPKPKDTIDGGVPELLHKNNYDSWSVRVRTYLESQDLWDVVEGEPPKDPSGDYYDNSEAALSVIMTYCGPTMMSVIEECDSAKDAWEKLSKEAGVRELLDKNNYDSWNVRVRTYLESRDHWDVIEGEPDNSDAALDVIKKSCGPTMMSVIKECHLAKDAWEKLFEAYAGRRESHVTHNPLYQCLPPRYKQLREAVMKHDWSTMMDCIKQLPREILIAKIFGDGDTALHWAVLHDNTSIVKQLVELMSAEELEAQNDKGVIALAQVATCGNIQMAECMLKKNRNLISIADRKNRIPVVRAFEYGVTDIALYLYKHTPLDVLQRDKTYVPTVVVSCIFANAFDIALHLLRRSPSHWQPMQKDMYGNSPLSALASQPSISFSRSQLLFWKRWIYACIPEQLVHSSSYKRKEITETIDETCIDINEQIQQQSHEANVYGSVLRLLPRILPNLLKLLGMKHIYEMRVRHVQALELQSLLCESITGLGEKAFEDVLMKSVEAGNHELIENVLRSDPKLLLRTDFKSRSLIAYAVLYRQPRIFSLIYGLQAKDEIINMLDQSGNTLLHMTGMLELATSQIERIPGAGLEMRRELQWFKEIERLSSPFTREMKNHSGEIAKETFTKNHKNMKDAGEKWMKETASSSSVVGALIITITFAATITVPGGNNGDKGFPVFSDKPIFLLFVISNALSFVSSIAAVLTFLVILTTSYAEEDFFISLPRKLMIGLSTLSFSIATMMIAFYAALFIMMPGQSWMVILIICLASISIIWFLLEKYPNLVEMTKSAYGPHMFDKKLKPGLYQGMPLPTDSLPTNVEASSSMS